MNDFELKKFVSSHSDQLNDIIWYFNQKKNQEVDKLLAELGLSAVFLDSNYPGCTFIEITSVGRIESGFIYATDSAKLPEISSERFVFVEEVLEGWFVYRII
jgi:predicted PolB exonuclease-like 3'-5' exonuclease